MVAGARLVSTTTVTVGWPRSRSVTMAVETWTDFPDDGTIGDVVCVNSRYWRYDGTAWRLFAS